MTDEEEKDIYCSFLHESVSQSFCEECNEMLEEWEKCN